MDTTPDNPSFDYQSMYLSFEERRWLARERLELKLDLLVKSVAEFHTKISGCEYFSSFPALSSSSPIIADPGLSNDHALYYPSDAHGSTDSQIDHFRLHHQQMFRSIYEDLSKEFDYRIFFIILEAVVFYSSQTVKEYTSTWIHQTRRLLSTFAPFVRSRSSRMVDILSEVCGTSLPCYTFIHKHDQNNCGVLCQLLPKIHYPSDPTVKYQSIVTMKPFESGTLSPEELRFIDYSMHLKGKRHNHFIAPRANSVAHSKAFNGSIGLTGPGKFDVLHSLPIIYPFNDTMVYGGKYPAFWTGDHHLNESSDRIFQLISVDNQSAEYRFAQRMFQKTVSPDDRRVIIIDRIQNAHLWEKFSAHRSYLRRKNGNEHLNEEWFFHGTRSNNHQQILSHGFNRSYCSDTVLFGRGVYFSRYAGYSTRFSDAKNVSFLLLTRVLVGHHTPGSNDIRVPPDIVLAGGKRHQADSTTDNQTPYSMACTYHDDQNYPEYIITYVNTSVAEK